MNLRVFVNLGEVYFGAGDVLVETLLGSCVAITFWHPQRHLGGLCHFVLPARRQPVVSAETADSKLDGRYGEDALLCLLREVQRHDSAAADYTIKVFGGGRILGLASPRQPIGQANAEFALAILQRHKLQVSAQDIAGEGYRYLRFDLNNGDVWVRHGHAGPQEMERGAAQ
jgi:chemotaxis protein CheD